MKGGYDISRLSNSFSDACLLPESLRTDIQWHVDAPDSHALIDGQYKLSTGRFYNKYPGEQFARGGSIPPVPFVTRPVYLGDFRQNNVGMYRQRLWIGHFVCSFCLLEAQRSEPHCCEFTKTVRNNPLLERLSQATNARFPTFAPNSYHSP